EKNVGPLSDSPAIKQLMMDFATGAGGPPGQGPFGDLFTDGKGNETSLGKLADVSNGSSNWKFPDLGIGKADFGWTSPPSFSGPEVPSGGAPSIGGVEGGAASSWLPVVILAAAAGVGLLLWWLWPRLLGARSG